MLIKIKVGVPGQAILYVYEKWVMRIEYWPKSYEDRALLVDFTPLHVNQ